MWGGEKGEARARAICLKCPDIDSPHIFPWIDRSIDLKSAFDENEYNDLMNDFGQNSPLAGLGYGLPISRG